MSDSFTNILAGAYIDRVAHRRKDAQWLEQAVGDARSLFVPVWRSRSLLRRSSESTAAALLQRDDALLAALWPQSANHTFLGIYREQACFAISLDERAEIEAQTQSFNYEFQDIRTLLSTIERDEAGLLAYARALITWQEKHRYCGKCGAPTQLTQAGHAAKCTADSCSLETFPRIDPAIIVLITDGDRALLGRQAAWRPGWYSTIAGFVEPGESLEDAVRREALEETGVAIGGVRYHSSQPWPFPQSLMLGFIAETTTTAIHCSDTELEDARWFTRADIANGRVMTPPPISISGCLIETWYDRQAERPLREEPAARNWYTRGR